MLYAVLICSDEACAEEVDAWGEPEEFEQLVCEGCGSLLQPLSFAEAAPPTGVVHLRRRTTTLQLRRAA